MEAHNTSFEKRLPRGRVERKSSREDLEWHLLDSAIPVET